jgi:uncharacterized RDD family membrane protein YckC
VTTNFTFASAYHDIGAPEPLTRPDLFEGVLWRRFFAYLIDACCIGAIVVVLWFFFLLLTILSFGLLGPVLWFLLGLVPLAYHTFLVGGRRSATLGMRVFGLQMYAWDGTRPMLLQALVHTVLFYASVSATAGLILLFALFNRRRRTLHDILAGMLMLRRPDAARTGPDPWRPDPGRW